MSEKDQVCCGRLKGRLVHERGNLARLARNAASRAGKGLHVSDEAKAAILEAKDAIHSVEQAIIDHDADHAAEASERDELERVAV